MRMPASLLLVLQRNEAMYRDAVDFSINVQTLEQDLVAMERHLTGKSKLGRHEKAGSLLHGMTSLQGVVPLCL